MNSIIGIFRVAELDETKAVLEGNLTKAAVVFEEAFDITVRGVSGKMSQVHTGGHVMEGGKGVGNGG